MLKEILIRLGLNMSNNTKLFDSILFEIKDELLEENIQYVDTKKERIYFKEANKIYYIDIMRKENEVIGLSIHKKTLMA